MKNDYIIFVINEIKKAIDNNQDELYIGYDDFAEKSIGFNISIHTWNEYMNILNEYAIDEECYEHCDEISELQLLVAEYVEDYFDKKTHLTKKPKS
jgi:hypothetical protein